ncbi:unnamed protein product [Larinioides sclopetarius]|uniref:Secreted protein n=1 Tax=Larinioides sclopetarius TaxID=280406 RepID=A0AAV2A077_9ARAC
MFLLGVTAGELPSKKISFKGFILILMQIFFCRSGRKEDGLRNFERRTDEQDDTRAGTPLFSKLPHCTASRTCNNPHTRRFFIGV